MAIGVIIIFLVLVLPFVLYYITNKDSIDRDLFRQVIKYLLVILSYILIVNILNWTGILEISPFQLFFHFWPLLLVFLGIKQLISFTHQGVVSGIVLIALGFIFLSQILGHLLENTEEQSVVLTAFSVLMEGIAFLFWPLMGLGLLFHIIYSFIKD